MGARIFYGNCFGWDLGGGFRLIGLGFRLAGGRTFFLFRQEESSQRRRRSWDEAGSLRLRLALGSALAGRLTFSCFAKKK
jgi:hypothetical protein